MADIELVIKIDEETLQDLYDSRYVSPHIKDVFRSAILLPKGRGDLVDRNDLKYEKYNSYAYAIANAPTIIPTDKEGEEVWEQK